MAAFRYGIGGRLARFSARRDRPCGTDADSSAHLLLDAYEGAAEARSVLGALVARVAVFDRRQHAIESTLRGGYHKAGDRERLGGGGLCRHRLLENELAAQRVDPDRVALAEAALEQRLRERVLDQALERPLQRPRAVRRVPAGLDEVLLRGVGELDRQPALREPPPQLCELQLDDVGELLLRQRMELDDLVDPVQELRPEDVAHRL